MAQLMADCDLAIGAAGVTSWERCCLGVPTIMLVLAENQSAVAEGLKQAGAAWLIEKEGYILERLPVLLAQLLPPGPQLTAMSEAAGFIVDGRGVNSIVTLLES